jgi:hypothetical protein
LKRISTQALDDDLVATPGDQALAYGTVTKYLREAQSEPAKVPLPPMEVHLTSNWIEPVAEKLQLLAADIHSITLRRPRSHGFVRMLAYKHTGGYSHYPRSDSLGAPHL